MRHYFFSITSPSCQSRVAADGEADSFVRAPQLPQMTRYLGGMPSVILRSPESI